MVEIGLSLRRAREGRGLALTEVEAATRIRERYLAALEQENFEALPPGYARAFLHSYAAYLGLDVEQLVDAYAVRFPDAEAISPSAPQRARRRLPLSRGRLAVLAGVAALLALLAAGEFGSGQQRPALPSPETPTSRPSPALKSRSVTLRPRHRLSARPRIVLAAAGGECWIAVRLGSRAGPLLYENLLQPGQTVSFARRALWVRVGAPSNLLLKVDGRRLAPLSGSAPVDIVLDRSGARLT